jgi:hypothetical protein
MAIVEIMYRIAGLRGDVPSLIQCSGDGAMFSCIVFLESLSTLKETAAENSTICKRAGALLLERDSAKDGGAITVEFCGRLARVAFELNDIALTMDCCKRALQFSEEDCARDVDGESRKSLAKWLASVNIFQAKALSRKAADCKGSTEETILLAGAAEHFAASVKLCALIVTQQYGLMMTSLKLLYNIAASKSVPKRMIVKQLELAVHHAVTALNPNKDLISEADMEFFTSLILLVLDAQTTECRWQEGLNVIDQSMLVLPRKQDSLLWQLKVVFLTKAGKYYR